MLIGWLSAEFIFSIIKCGYLTIEQIMNLSSVFSNSYHWSTSCWPCYRLRRGPWSRTYWVQSKCTCTFSSQIQQWLTNLIVLETSRPSCSCWFGALTYRCGSLPCNPRCHCPGRLLIPRDGIGRHVSCDTLYCASPYNGKISAASETESPRRNIAKAVTRVFYRIVVFYVCHSFNYKFIQHLMMCHYRFLVLLW